MPYYHVYIVDRDSYRKEFDFSKKQLMKFIVEPYSVGKRFMFKGLIVVPSNIRQIRIIRTERPSYELLRKIKAETSILKRLVSEIDDFRLLEKKGKDVTREVLFDEERGQKKAPRKKRVITFRKNVFVVHGRDHKPVKELKAMLFEFGLNPIVLHEQPSGSRTLVEKLEKYSDVGYVFVILTPDDIGAFSETLDRIKDLPLLVPSTGSLLRQFGKRARQNVILEFGYFMGLLGRDKVCCLHKGDVELPSDMHGIVYISFKESMEEARYKIIKELKAAGYEIKL